MFPTFISLGYSDDIIHNHLNHILKRKFSKIFIVIKHSHISQQFVFSTAKTSSESTSKFSFRKHVPAKFADDEIWEILPMY